MDTAQHDSRDPICARPATPITPLQITHSHLPVAELLRDSRTLAVFGFGSAAALINDPRCVRVALEPLRSATPLEVWCTTRTVSSGRDGPVAWSCDGDYSFACIELDEGEHGGITAATCEAYRLMLSWCRSSPTPHLLRIWNYIDAINLGAGDDERYRLFCSGRAAGMKSPDGVYPAATAIGVRDGRRHLQVCWLSARQAGSPRENPRQISAWRYPRRYGPDPPGFARGMRAPDCDGQLYVSGTAAVVGHASHHADDIGSQVDETLANLGALLAAAGLAAPVHHSKPGAWRVYVRHAADADLVEQRVHEHFGNAAGLVLLGGDICRRELLVEIDGIHGN